MYLRPVIAVVLRYYYLLRGTPARWVPIFAWVAIDIVLWGFISKYLNSVTSSGLNFVPTLLGAVLLFDFFTRVMHGVAGVFLEDVWSRSFLNLFASPITIPQYFLGLVITTTVASLIGLVVMLVLATAIFGLSFFAYGLMLVPFLLILFLFGVALGICTSAVVLRLGPAAEWFVWPVPAVVSPFAGVFYPISILSAWMQFAGKLLPLSYVFEGLRTIIAWGNLHKNRMVRLVQVGVDAAKGKDDFIEGQTDYCDVFTLKRVGKLLRQRVERLHVASDHLRCRRVGIVVQISEQPRDRLGHEVGFPARLRGHEDLVFSQTPPSRLWQFLMCIGLLADKPHHLARRKLAGALGELPQQRHMGSAEIKEGLGVDLHVSMGSADGAHAFKRVLNENHIWEPMLPRECKATNYEVGSAYSQPIW